MIKGKKKNHIINVCILIVFCYFELLNCFVNRAVAFDDEHFVFPKNNDWTSILEIS